MLENNHEALADPNDASADYRSHTVEILTGTASMLVTVLVVYLTFFDGRLG